MRRFLVPFCALAVAGCTHVATTPSQNLGQLGDGQSLRGKSYSLPAMQYTIKTKRLITECPAGAAPKFDTVVEVTSRYVAGESYEVDPTSLSSILKTSNVGLTFHEDNDTLKGFNASANDKTGEIIADVARIGVAAASIATTGVPVGLKSNTQENAEIAQLLGALGQARPRASLACTAEAATRVAAYKAAKDTLDTATAALEATTKRIAAEKELAAFRGYDSAAMSGLIALVGTSLTQSGAVDAAKKTLADAEKPIALTTEEVWPKVSRAIAPSTWPAAPVGTIETISAKFCENFSPGAVATTDRLKLLINRGEVKAEAACTDITAALGEVTKLRATFVRETERAENGGNPSPMVQSLGKGTVAKGILVREPERGRLRIEKLADGEWTKAFQDEARWIPQLGRLRFLPFESGPFENEAMSVSLRPDGRVESLAYETKDAALARLAAAGASAAEKIAQGAKDRETRRREDEKYLRELAANSRADAANARADRLAVVQFEIDERTKAQALLLSESTDAAASVAASVELSRTKAEIDQLKAEKERLELQRAVAALRETAT